MSYFDASAWQPAPPPAWDARSAASTPQPVEETGAFTSQIEEVDRALDNLMKSGKFFPPRRDGMPLGLAPSAGLPHGPTTPIDPRMAQSMGRPPFNSLSSDSEIIRSQSSMSGLNNFYAPQRFVGPVGSQQQQQAQQAQQPQRVSDVDQVAIKRRLAAARERELRNFHQEQQFHRSMSPDTTRKMFSPLSPTGPMLNDIPSFGPSLGLGKDRVMSPSALSEDDRRDLMSRQHRSLYGADAASIADEQSFLRSASASVDSRGVSPALSFDPFQQRQLQQQQQFMSQQNTQQQLQQQNAAAPHQSFQQSAGSAIGRPTTTTSPNGHSRSNSNGTSSPSSRSANFSFFDSTTTQQSVTSASSPDQSPPPRAALSRVNTSSTVAPIGTRPSLGGGLPTGPIGSRPAIGSPFGLGPESDTFGHLVPERSSSAASNLSSLAGAESTSLSNSLNASASTVPTGAPIANAGTNNNNMNTSAVAPGSSATNPMAWSSKVWGNKGLSMAASVWG
ncbi:uncharacterized protein V1516DRAFT_687492 [Lipomyces oligophaga]|uniref:uncharacterized protein n=1 Tax=Lipomyces oligophaga TaxID=45792 RepID=UPI0034CFC675